MKFSVDQKTFAFIDASNIIYGAKDSGWFIDQKKLFGYLKNKYKISKAFFYYGKDSGNLKQTKFLEKLAQFGYTLRVKEIKRFGTKTKANCDVDLTMDTLLLLKNYEKAIFLTGDGDFLPLFEYLRVKGKKEITIISWPRRTAREIKRFAGEEFVDMNGLKYLLERPIKKGEDSKLESFPSTIIKF